MVLKVIPEVEESTIGSKKHEYWLQYAQNSLLCPIGQRNSLGYIFLTKSLIETFVSTHMEHRFALEVPLGLKIIFASYLNG